MMELCFYYLGFFFLPFSLLLHWGFVYISWLQGLLQPAHPAKCMCTWKRSLVCRRVLTSLETACFSLAEWLTVVLQRHNRRLSVCLSVLTLDVSIKVWTLECTLSARHSRSGSLPSAVSAGVADRPCCLAAVTWLAEPVTWDHVTERHRWGAMLPSACFTLFSLFLPLITAWLRNYCPTDMFPTCVTSFDFFDTLSYNFSTLRL